MSEPNVDAWPLQSREGLPTQFAWLRDGFPRNRWGETTVPQTASHWLGMHDSFRQAGAHMDQLGAAHRSGAVDLRGFHDRMLPTLSRFLQHLYGHHRIETGHYFPIFRRIEPRIAAGIDLLDRDHDAIHAHLESMAERGNALHRSIRSGASSAADDAARLADAVETASPPLLRHLDDEEDIVIPLLALRGEPPG